MNGGGGRLRVYEGVSEGTEEQYASLDEAIRNAAASAGDVPADGEWFDVVRIQAQVLPHNQYVRLFKVIVTPSSD